MYLAHATAGLVSILVDGRSEPCDDVDQNQVEPVEVQEQGHESPSAVRLRIVTNKNIHTFKYIVVVKRNELQQATRFRHLLKLL